MFLVFINRKTSNKYKLLSLSNLLLLCYQPLPFLVKNLPSPMVGTPSPLIKGSPLLKGGEGGRIGPSKNWVTWGVSTFLLERGDCYRNGIWGVGTFFITLQFNHIYFVCGKSKVSFITFWFFSFLNYPCKILIQVFIVLKHCLSVSDPFW